MSCGTPVAAFDRGALGEIVVEGTGALARAGDVDALAEAIVRARELDRSAVRRHAVENLGVARMISAYEDVYARARSGAAA
jgi:glycosyltransferase involved in cell wall biosynthesis